MSSGTFRISESTAPAFFKRSSSFSLSSAGVLNARTSNAIVIDANILEFIFINSPRGFLEKRDERTLISGRTAAKEVREQRYDEHDEEQEKEDLGNPCRRKSNAAKTQKSGDQRDNQENQCVVKHCCCL